MEPRTMPVVRKKKKLNAYERLWEDAQPGA